MSEKDRRYKEYVEEMAKLKTQMFELRQKHLECTGGVTFPGVTMDVEVRLEVVCPYPGGRYTKNGPWSGEYFREEILIPLLRYNPYTRIKLDLDGVPGIASCWMSEVFHGLSDRVGIHPLELRKRLSLICEDDP